MSVSSIYRGHVRHERWKPAGNRFTYSMYMMYLDLDEVDRVFRGRWLWSAHRMAFARFQALDHLRIVRNERQASNAVGMDGDLRELLLEVLREKGVAAPIGKIGLLTQLRYLGFTMNPVSFFYCYDARNDSLAAVVAEVNNTPWGEQHIYVIQGGEPSKWVGVDGLAKEFHVSPFLPMEMTYDMKFSRPGKRLGVRIENFQDAERALSVVMNMKREPITGFNLARCLVQYPLISFKIAAAIYWQALKLYLKGCRFFPHPDKEEGTTKKHDRVLDRESKPKKKRDTILVKQ
ncbi:MAG: DUF1365 domain-containing protein [Mariniblastus sp.]|nr:DUF1365 domain-containing protein [Mariniblastus sp.]